MKPGLYRGSIQRVSHNFMKADKIPKAEAMVWYGDPSIESDVHYFNNLILMDHE